VLLEGNRAGGVEAWVRPPGPWRGSGDSPDGVALTVRAPMVVVAGGGVESPALLLRSGLRHAALGRNLYLHPATSVAGVFDSEVAAWSGPLQSAHSDQFANLDGEGYGFKFETTPLYPGLAATALPWVSGADFKARMLNLKNVLSLLVLCRDRVGGRVRLDRQGNARIDYVVSRYDREHMLRGVREGARLTLAAGARDVYTLNSLLTSIGRKERNNPLAWQRFDSRVDRLGAAPNSMMVFSAHQMGSCRMSADPGHGVVDGNGAVHGYRGLYVADGSVFPLSSGVNPMITIMGLAHWIGTRLAEG
jgi:choline dehydrogenase-like flavoprotein